MKAGRNDPCPCGSGKKFKKCCMRQEQAAEAARVAQEQARQRAAQAALEERPAPFTPAPPTPLPPPDPLTQAMNAAWKEFEGQDYEGRIALYEKTLQDEQLMDDEMAYGMLSAIHSQAAAKGEWDRFRGLVTALQQRLPEVYEANARTVLPWLISDALATGRDDELTRTATAFARLAGDYMDEFIGVVDQLAYHGRLSVLVEMARIAWPAINDSGEVLPWAVADFGERAADYEMFLLLEQGVVPDLGDPDFLDRLRSYLPGLDVPKLGEYLDRLTGKTQRRWTPEDFNLQPRPKKGRRDEWDDDYEERTTPEIELPGRRNLANLGTEFEGYLRREEAVPWPRAQMGKQSIIDYLVERLDGELQARENIVEAMMRRGRPKPRPQDPPPLHLLCPDHTTLDRYLGGMLSFFSFRIYDVVATIELIPAWLRFLERHALITREENEKTLEAVRPLVPTLSKLFQDNYEGRLFGQVLRNWATGECEEIDAKPPVS